jgi:hypothetical protein
MTRVVIIPTTGRPSLKAAVASVLGQTSKTHCYVVCDGEAHRPAVSALLQGAGVTLCVLPHNVGRDGYNGHRIYAAFSHLVDEDVVFFLDEDNFYAPDHVASCVALLESASLDWVHSLRTIVDIEGRPVCRDDCESLGRWTGFTNRHLVDTSAFCLRRQVLIRTAQLWHGKRGRDGVYTQALMRYFPRFDCTGRYTLNYRLGGSPASVKAEFFHAGNQIMASRYGQRFPWDLQGGAALTAPAAPESR